jgi:hypothetical protein
MTAPVRIQRKRTKGWRMPANTVYVGRGASAHGRSCGRFGNPLRPGMWNGYSATDAVRDYRQWINREPGVRSFDGAFGKPPSAAEIETLRGKNLACWCELDQPCHADVLLEIANR